MSVFVHAHGIKPVHAGGEVKKWQNSVHVVVECPLIYKMGPSITCQEMPCMKFRDDLTPWRLTLLMALFDLYACLFYIRPVLRLIYHCVQLLSVGMRVRTLTGSSLVHCRLATRPVAQPAQLVRFCARACTRTAQVWFSSPVQFTLSSWCVRAHCVFTRFFSSYVPRVWCEW